MKYIESHIWRTRQVKLRLSLDSFIKVYCDNVCMCPALNMLKSVCAAVCVHVRVNTGTHTMPT